MRRIYNETMQLSQLLITPESFPSLPLAGTTLLQRARIWVEGDGGGSRRGAVRADPTRPPVQCSPPWGRRAAHPLPPKKTMSLMEGGDGPVSCLERRMMAASGLVSPLAGSGLGFRVQCSAPGPGTGARQSCTLLGPAPCFGISLCHVGFDSVDVRMVWRFLWVVLPAAAAP